jgi:hypothetical protein
MLSRQIDDAERKEVLENDRRVREEQSEKRRALRENEPSTFMAHTHNDVGGRFREVEAMNVIGSEADIAASYPAASSAHQTELPPEMPLGYSINDLGPDFPCQGQDGEPAVPSAFDVERGSPLNPELGVSFPSRQATGPATPSSPLAGAGPLSQSGDPEDFEGRCDGRGPSDIVADGFSGSSPSREYRRMK